MITTDDKSINQIIKRNAVSCITHASLQNFITAATCDQFCCIHRSINSCKGLIIHCDNDIHFQLDIAKRIILESSLDGFWLLKHAF